MWDAVPTNTPVNPVHLVHLHQSPSHPRQLYLWLRRCSGQCPTPERAWPEQCGHWLLWTHDHQLAGSVMIKRQEKVWIFQKQLKYEFHSIKSSSYLSILVPLQCWGREGLSSALQGQRAVDLDLDFFGSKSFPRDIILIDVRGDWSKETCWYIKKGEC